MMHPNMQDFATFARSMPPERSYKWEDGGICACGQFARKIGVGDWQRAEPSLFWNRANEIAGEGPHTFGALAERIDREVSRIMRQAQAARAEQRFMVEFPMRVMPDRRIVVDIAF